MMHARLNAICNIPPNSRGPTNSREVFESTVPAHDFFSLPCVSILDLRRREVDATSSDLEPTPICHFSRACHSRYVCWAHERIRFAAIREQEFEGGEDSEYSVLLMDFVQIACHVLRTT